MKGYSLLELSAVLAVIAVVIGLSLSAGDVQIRVSNHTGTQNNLELVRDALNLYQKKYKRYPCPAGGAVSNTDASYGVEEAGCATSCSANLVCPASTSAAIGMVPFRTLGLNEETVYDKWGNRLSYAVDTGHTGASSTAGGSLLVVDKNNNEITASPVLGDAIFVVLSHGPNGAGAWNKTGTVATACGSANARRDVENCDLADVKFRDAAFNAGDVASKYFDDLIVWQTQGKLADPSAAGAPIPMLAIGGLHSCIALSNGTVKCWGNNDYGQLGDNNNSIQLTPQPVPGLSGVVDIDSGELHTCIRKGDGSAMCWGYNGEGQIGDNTTINRPVPTVVPGLIATAVEGGGYNSCALMLDATVRCWGRNVDGQVGDNNPNPRRQVPTAVALLTSVKQVEPGSNHSCALKSDGTVWCWGNNFCGRVGNGVYGNGPGFDAYAPVQTTGLTGASLIASGGYHSCAIKPSTDEVYCWGWNNKGQMGNGTVPAETNGNLVPTVVPDLTGAGVTALSLGDEFSCALLGDRTVKCWGDNDYGQIGNNTTTAALVPATVSGLGSVKQLSSGYYHTCALKTDNSIWCWGSNSNGQIGDGTWSNRLVPVKITY